MSTTILVIGLMVFFAHFLSLQFRKTSIPDVLVLVRLIYRAPAYGLCDTAITSMLAPKGLAAAVLATLPLQSGVAGGETIRDMTYMVVLVSISFTALLVIAYPSGTAQRIYARILGKTPDAAPKGE